MGVRGLVRCAMRENRFALTHRYHDHHTQHNTHRHVIGGFVAVAVAFVANVQGKPQYLTFFALYFAGVREIIKPGACDCSVCVHQQGKGRLID